MAHVNAIRAEGLGKRYGRHHAVADLSFAVATGEVVGFLGPNGAGKTTTLRMLAGLVRPSEGRAQVLGRPVPGAVLRRVGTMIEEPTFHDAMTGRNALRHAAMLHGDVPPQRIDEVLAFVRLEGAASKRVRAYSQGMRQRLGLARALLHRPDVLLLDEPTNGLDPVGIREIRESLRQVAASGVAILISSHILAEIEKLVDRVLAVDQGRLRFDGPLAALLARKEERAAVLRLRALDRQALAAALAALDLADASEGADSARVTVPAAEVPALLRSLLNDGVDLIEARREGEDLEEAYLNLVTAGEGPT